MQLSQTEIRRRITAAMSSREPAPREFSLARALAAMVNPRGLQQFDGAEGALAAAAAEAEGLQHDPHRIRWPLAQMATRDLNAANLMQGGALVGSDLARPWEPLRPWSVVLQGGATVWSGLQGNVPVPRVIADPTAYWLSTETTSVTESNATFGGYAMTPKTVGCYVECSRQLLLQALRGKQFEDLLSSMMLRAVGKALDTAIISGTGTSGQPAGLAGTAGVGTASGTSLSWASVCGLRASAVDAIGNDRGVSWVGGSSAQSVLAQRERFAGGGHPIWDNYEIAGIPAFVSNAVPATTLALGDWSYVIVGLWGESVQLELNPFGPPGTTAFQEGRVGFRVLLQCDFHVVNPAYFSIVSSIT